MMRLKKTEKQIVEACILGARESWKRYERWLGAGGPSGMLGRKGGQTAPESLLQVTIARSLHRVSGGEDGSLEEVVGRHPELGWPKTSKRIDVIGWSRAEVPVALIELKRGWGGHSLDKQMDYLWELANRMEVSKRKHKRPLALAVSCTRRESKAQLERFFDEHDTGDPGERVDQATGTAHKTCWKDRTSSRQFVVVGVYRVNQ